MRKCAVFLLMASLVITGCVTRAPATTPAITPPPPGVPTSPDQPTISTISSDGRPSVFSERGDERVQMVDNTIASRGVTNPTVLDAMLTVPRHAFVPADFQTAAYNDHPLPIGFGQTISQPFIVALMTEVIEPEAGDVILEIGTGSGYQAAVLAEIVSEVYTIEIVGALVERVEDTFSQLAYDNITVRHGDGYFGWEEHAPFDAIIVTAAPDHVPPPLKDQLADGGRMILPVGPPGGYQELWLVERDGDQFTTTSLGGVAFVPLTRDVRDE